MNWFNSECTDGWVGAPAIDSDGNVIGTCRGSALFKLDRSTGSTLAVAGQQRNPSEIMIDGQDQIKSGYQAFNGVFFQGNFCTWNRQLQPVSCDSGYTSSRASLLPDGASSVRVGYVFDVRSLSFQGSLPWEVYFPSATVPMTVPTTDPDGNIYVANGQILVSLDPADGATRWNLQLDGDVITQPVIAEDGVIYVGTANGRVYRLESSPYETLQMPSDGSAVVSGTVLQRGVTYTVRASGVVSVGNGTIADAEWQVFSDGTVVTACQTTPPIDMGLSVDDDVNDDFKLPDWGGYNDSHVYSTSVVGAGLPLTFRFHDCYYPDNSGTLTIEIIPPQ